MLRSLLMAFSFLMLADGQVEAQDKPKKTTEELLVGKWKLEKSESDLPKGAKATIEIKKDKTMKVTIEIDGNAQTVEGTWKLDGDKKMVTTLKLPGGDRTETMTIKKLTEDEFITVDEKDKKDEFSRIKD